MGEGGALFEVLGAGDSKSDKEETEREKKNSGQEGEQNDIEEDNDIRNEAAAFWYRLFKRRIALSTG